MVRGCFFFQAEDGIRDYKVTGVQTCALPIWTSASSTSALYNTTFPMRLPPSAVTMSFARARSEEHTSELQSPCNLVCRLLLEKKKKYLTRKVTCHTIAIKHRMRKELTLGILN